MLILGVFTQIAGVRSPSDEPIIWVPIKKNRKLLQRDEVKKLDEDSEKDEDNHDDDKEGVHPNSHKHFIPYMGFCASIWDSVRHHCHHHHHHHDHQK